jgi:hypothetical protein
MNSFDAAVYIGLVVAVVTGFNAGLLRSAVTILAYLIAMPIAVLAMSLISPRDRRPCQLAADAEFAAVVRNFSRCRHRAGKADANGAR